MRMTLLSLLVSFVCGCASVRAFDVSSVPTYTVEAINADPEGTVGKVMTSGSLEMVVQFRKGDRVPLHLKASLGPIAVEPGQDFVVFAKDVYLYFCQDGIFLSPDRERWAAVQDGAALGEVFGLGTGTLQIGFGIGKGEQAAVTLVAERK